MASYETKSVKVKRGFTYGYWFAKAQAGKPTLVFFHGFPESKYCWRAAVAFFSKQGYGVVAPDLLGYDGTDKPNDVKQYIHLEIAKDVVDILDHEGIDKFVSVGHDWGVLPAARAVNAFPDRAQALVLLAAGYFPPKGHWDTPKFCELTKGLLGYETMGYFPFYGGVNEDGLATTPTEATKAIQKNFDSFMALMFCEDSNVWTEHFCPYDKARQWITSNRQGPYNKKISKEEFDVYRKIIHRDIHTNLMWYRAVQLDLQYEPEQSLPDESANIKCPYLFMSTDRDSACQAAIYKPAHEAFAKDREEVAFDTSHWITSEEPDKVNTTLKDFVDRKVKA